MTTNEKHKWYLIIGGLAVLIIAIALRYWDVTDGLWSPIGGPWKALTSWWTKDWF